MDVVWKDIAVLLVFLSVSTVVGLAYDAIVRRADMKNGRRGT